MSDVAPVRLALIGLGWAVHELWAPLLGGHPGFTVVAVHDPDPVAVRWAGGRFPAARLLNEPGDLRPDEVDLAVVVTPNHLHAPIAISLLERGISTFVEKPVCVSSDEAAALAEAERVGGARLLAGSAAWHRADVTALRTLLPRLGPLRAVELSWIRARGIPAPGGWFTDRRRAGGGALIDLGWHLITIGMRMLSWPRVTQVTCAVSGDFLARAGTEATWRGTGPAAHAAPYAGAPKDVEDTARGVLEIEGGPLVTVCAAWASHSERDVTRVVLDGATGRAELTCTFGLSPNGVGGSTLLLHRDGRAESVDVPQQDRGAEYRRQLDLVPALLADPGRPGSAIAEVTRTIDIIERLYQSAGVPQLTAVRPR
ncbi:Gfo/Idh/MocA family protein [Plantactinospora sp. BC1]|uniref:Gfo/Idh/MocA family protein n=1 Tax=Plantactinospora sp. BC1 TaxID=2108470 RepID=UPI001F1A2459|nr:Gfo/Idh/MocA family oxidoreductase [Plantactinospora sp. BC1]